MKRFAIKLTHGDDVTILGVRDTRTEAMELGTALRKQYSRDAGLLALIEADFDENDRMIGNGYKLHEVFR